MLEEMQPYRLSMLVCLKDLRALYTRHFLYSSEEDYKEPRVVDESKPKLKVIDEPNPESPILVELDVF